MALINHIDEDHDYRVAIPWNSVWTNLAAREQQWNDAAAWALEYFGLPGDRYTCRPTTKNLEFWFRTESDALMFQIRWSS
jgi:hypothetical protein